MSQHVLDRQKDGHSLQVDAHKYKGHREAAQNQDLPHCGCHPTCTSGGVALRRIWEDVGCRMQRDSSPHFFNLDLKLQFSALIGKRNDDDAP